MKKNYLLLAVTAIMMSVGAYSLVDTKEASVLMSLKEVEALADQESDGGQHRGRDTKLLVLLKKLLHRYQKNLLYMESVLLVVVTT